MTVPAVVAAAAAAVGAAAPYLCPDVTQFGCNATGLVRCDGALAAALHACVSAGGGTLPFEAGTYLLAPFCIPESVSVLLRAHATLRAAPPSDADWPLLAPFPSYDDVTPRYAPFIRVANATGVALLGEGETSVIDGGGQAWWDAQSAGTLNGTRPVLVSAERTRGFVLANLTLRQTPFWASHIWASEEALVDGLFVRNPTTSPNGDGVDVDSSSNVTLRRLDISTSDDHVAIKSGKGEAGRRFGRPSSNVTVVDCTFRQGLGVAIGTEMSGGVHGVRVRRNTFGFGAQSAARVKSAPGRGGVMRDLLWEDNEVRGTVVAVSVQMAYKPGPPENSSSPGTPHLRGLTVRNLTGYSLRGGELLCLEESPCTGIELEGIQLTAALGWTCEYAYGRAEGVVPAPSCLA